MLDDATYASATAQLFKRLIKACDQVDPDLLEADGSTEMLTITATRTGEKIIVNTQRAVQQVWVAGKGEGVHFSLDASGRWLDDRGKGLEVVAWVVECVRAAVGVTLAL
jgi:CyaY protein